MKINYLLIALTLLSTKDLTAQVKDDQKKLSEVVVSSTALERTLLESAQPINIINEDNLLSKVKGSLGETLSTEAGVSSSYFGAGASRPVIRGLSGDRIKILENGASSQDISNTSPDHATTIEPALAEKIEIVRGAATLLYGTSAVGGVVNVFDGRIPNQLPDKDLTGILELQGASADKQRAGVFSLTAPVDNFAIHFEGSKRKSDDYSIPGYARTAKLRSESELEFDEPRHKVPFSDTESDNLSIGSSYFFDSGYVGLALSEYNSNYGVPNGEENISIDAERRRLDLQAEFDNPVDILKKINTKLSTSDYEHTEFEGAEAGTFFSQDSTDLRVEFQHQDFLDLRGLFGFQFQTADFKALGEEAYIPPTDSDIFSGFIFEEKNLTDRLVLQLGARADLTKYDSKDFGEAFPLAQSKDIDSYGQTIGLVYKVDQDYSYALSLAHTERAASAQELFANGPHIATAAYEIGDVNLNKERSIGVDLSARKETGFVRGFISGFYNHFNDYISLAANGDEIDELTVYRFEQLNADFIGFETQLALHFIDQQEQKLSFDIQPDYVRATDRDNDRALPRIPALRIKTGINYYDQELFKARLEAQHVFEQNRNAEFETDSDAYTLVNLYLSKDIKLCNTTLELFANGTNLANETIRDHTSFIKDITPLPGISVLSGVRYKF